jgi:hypothetical protein
MAEGCPCECRSTCHLLTCSRLLSPAACLPASPCSSEHAFAPGTPQHAWVKADLAAVDRSKTPWVIVGMHRMP